MNGKIAAPGEEIIDMMLLTLGTRFGVELEFCGADNAGKKLA